MNKNAMSKKSCVGLIAIVIAVVGWAIWRVATHYGYQTVWVDLGPIPEARNTPYYAAQKFLEQKGYKVKTSGLLAEVTDRLDVTDTLFLFYDHELEYETLSTDIDQWVRQGGHLVVTVHYLWDEDNKSSGDVYLDDLGVRQFLWPKELDDKDEKESAKKTGAENDTDDSADQQANADDGVDENTEFEAASSDQDDQAIEDQEFEEHASSEEFDESDSEDNHQEATDHASTDLDSKDGNDATEARNASREESDDAPINGNASDNKNQAADKIFPLKNLNIPKEKETMTLACNLDYAESVNLLPLQQGSHPLHIAFEPEYHVEDASGQAHAPFTEAPAHILQYPHGAGKITVLTDYFIFNDSNIGDYDHAFFLWWLAQDSPRVWMVYDKDSDTLVSLIWESAPYLCVSVLMALTGWLLYRGRRFGPILNVEHASRRQLQEHIDASTMFIWRREEQSRLIDEARQPVLSKCPIVDNQIIRSPRLQRTLEQLDISEERLLWALTTPSVKDEAEFVELIRLLQQLRMTL